jgi:hypothetical protein
MTMNGKHGKWNKTKKNIWHPFEFRDPYTRKTLYVISLVRPKLEYASCAWRPFNGAHIDRIERVQKKFVSYALRGLRWTDILDLPPYVDRCALIRLETLADVFCILSGRVNSSNFLSLISINAPWYHTRTGDFLLFEALMSSLVCSTFIYRGISFLIV